MSTLPDLSHLAEPLRGGHPDVYWEELAWIINDAILNHPRSQQVEVGPSDLGMECVRCLALKLAGVPEQRDVAWLPAVGTAFHAWLDRTMTAYNAQFHEGTERFLTELRVDVGEVDGRTITGNLDLYDRCEASVTDWKLVGVTTLKRVRALRNKGNQTDPGYRVQGHLYGRGVTRRGLPVERVRVAYLPRNSVHGLADAIIWDEPYDEQVALDALARAEAISQTTQAIGLDKFLTMAPRAAGCYSCARYPDSDGNLPPVPRHMTRSDAIRTIIAPNPVVA